MKFSNFRRRPRRRTALTTKHYDAMAKGCLLELSTEPVLPHRYECILDTMLQWDASAEEWIMMAEQMGLFVPPSLREYGNPRNAIVNLINSEVAGPSNAESEVTAVGGTFSFTVRDDNLVMTFGYDTLAEGEALVEAFGGGHLVSKVATRKKRRLMKNYKRKANRHIRRRVGFRSAFQKALYRLEQAIEQGADYADAEFEAADWLTREDPQWTIEEASRALRETYDRKTSGRTLGKTTIRRRNNRFAKPRRRTRRRLTVPVTGRYRGSRRRRRVAAKQIPVANPEESTDRGGYYRSLFYFTFGAYGENAVYVWADNAEKGLDLAVQWLEETDPRSYVLISDDELKELYDEAAEEMPGADPMDIEEAATVDLTYTNDRWISYDWTINDVTNEDVMDEAARNDYVRHV